MLEHIIRDINIALQPYGLLVTRTPDAANDANRPEPHSNAGSNESEQGSGTHGNDERSDARKRKAARLAAMLGNR